MGGDRRREERLRSERKRERTTVITNKSAALNEYWIFKEMVVKNYISFIEIKNLIKNLLSLLIAKK